MPEQPEQKRAYHIATPAERSVGYAELHCLTNFSFLEAASHPDELVSRAGELGYHALAITDRNSLAGVVRAHAAAVQVGLKLLVGAEIVPVDAAPVVLLATDRKAYGRLARLITRGRRNAPKGECRIAFDDLVEHSAGLLACVFYDGCQVSGTDKVSGVRCQVSGFDLTPDTRHPTPLFYLQRYHEVFGDRCYLLVELHQIDDERILAESLELAKRTGVPPVAAGGVRFHVPERRPLADVLTAIRVGRPVAECGELLLTNAERYLKPAEELARLFPPALVRRTVEIADRCTFSLAELRYEYPEELAPPGETPLEYLIRLTWAGARDRYPAGIPDKVRQLLKHELALIAELHYEAYFLTVWDLVRFARSRGILCQGRGSAANSAVCYVLGVTSVDPDQMDVLFERFISRERGEAPDIDVDFEHERREEVIQYVYEKYGRERAGMTAEVITYRPRSAVRDVGKALGLSLERVDAVAKTIDGRGEEKLENRFQMAGLDPRSTTGRQLLAFVGELLGFPRHLSQHVGGLVITNGPLCELVPIENASMADRTVIEWDKDDLDELGILKVDCLALGMLTAIRKCFELVEKKVSGTVYAREAFIRSTPRSMSHKRFLTPFSLANIPPDDPGVYDMIGRADTIGVFQIESRAQMSMLPRLKPRCFYDLVIEVAIVRPGPIQGDMVHPYLRRRAGEEPVTYPNEAIRNVLHKTLGVPLFQEQAMQLAVVAAGFTPGEADQLRRAMAAWRRPGVIEQFRTKLIDGMLARGLTSEFAERLFLQIKGFGEYGFPESHAASFALLVYVSAWLKHHYPAAFCAAIINSQPMGFYAPAQLVRDAQQHGVEVRPIDVNHSRWDCTLENDCGKPQPSIFNSQLSALRLGLRMISGMSRAAALVIEQSRDAGPFRSLDDFARRTRLGQPLLARLSNADAFRSLALDRRQSLWQSLGHPQEDRPLFEDFDDSEPLVPLPAMSAQQEVVADYRTAGLSLKAHPISFYRAQLDAMQIVPAAALATVDDGRFIRVAGLVLLRQRPSTAKGITFVTLEDETGQVNLIVKPDIWERFYRVARTAAAFIAHGRLQKHREIIHLMVSKLESMAVAVNPRSRDFH
jgi:error-prone DNA polymerase